MQENSKHSNEMEEKALSKESSDGQKCTCGTRRVQRWNRIVNLKASDEECWWVHILDISNVPIQRTLQRVGS